MGEIADWLIGGGGCEWCGEFIGGEEGYPRLCSWCAKEAKEDGYKVRSDGLGGFQIIERPKEAS
jgi:hypothetical protein